MKINSSCSRGSGNRSRLLNVIWIFLTVMSILCTSCSSDEPVKKNPYVQSPTRALLKEVVEVRFDNVNGNADMTVDFGDGTVESGKASQRFTHQYTTAGDYNISVSADGYDVTKRIRIYNLLALSEATKQFRDTNCKKVWVMTHRARTTDHSIPENSLMSVEAAIASGAEMIECDTHITKDGQVVVCHDQTINATTNGSGDITQMTLEEIRQYNLLDRDGRVTTEKMPTLEEFLKAGRGRIYYNIDFSPRTASTKQVASIVQKLDMFESVLLYCDSDEKVQEVLDFNPKAQPYPWTGRHRLLIGRPGNYFVQYSYLTNGTSTALGSSLNDGMLCSVTFLAFSGSKVGLWTVNDTYLDELLSLYPQVHLIMTEVPDLLIPALEKRGLR